MEDYLQNMKTNANNLGQAGSLVPHHALVSQVLLGLDEAYNLVIVLIQGKLETSWHDMQSELLILKNCWITKTLTILLVINSKRYC